MKKRYKICNHEWRVGSYIGGFKGKRVVKKGINIWCEKCDEKIEAKYYSVSLIQKENLKLHKKFNKIVSRMKVNL